MSSVFFARAFVLVAALVTAGTLAANLGPCCCDWSRPSGELNGCDDPVGTWARQWRERLQAGGLQTSGTLGDILHGVWATGRECVVLDANGAGINAVNWLVSSGASQPGPWGEPLVKVNNGHYMFRGDLRLGKSDEAHVGQTLFMLMHAGLDPDATRVAIGAGTETITLRTMVHSQQHLCDTRGDVSWVLPVFARWGKAAWTNAAGESLDIDRLVDAHLRNRPISGACFGSHWCYALAFVARCEGAESSAPRARDALLVELRALRSAHRESGQFLPPGFVDPPGASAVSFQAHTLEWLLTGGLVDAADRPWLRAGVDWLMTNAPAGRSDLDFRTRAHVTHAGALYAEWEAEHPLPAPARTPAIPGIPMK